MIDIDDYHELNNEINKRYAKIRGEYEQASDARARVVGDLIGDLVIDSLISENKDKFSKPWRRLENEDDVLRAIAVDAGYLNIIEAKSLDRDELVFTLTKELDNTKVSQQISEVIKSSTSISSEITKLGLEKYLHIPQANQTS